MRTNHFLMSIVVVLCCLSLTGCISETPSVTLDKAFMRELPKGVGWKWLQAQQRPPFAEQCIFENDGATIEVKYVKKYDNSVLIPNHPDGAVIRRLPKSEYYATYEGSFGGVGVFIMPKDLVTEGCVLAWYKDGTDDSEITQSVSRYVAALRNAGVKINCDSIKNC